jgi:hypothetical protein
MTIINHTALNGMYYPVIIHTSDGGVVFISDDGDFSYTTVSGKREAALGLADFFVANGRNPINVKNSKGALMARMSNLAGNAVVSTAHSLCGNDAFHFLMEAAGEVGTPSQSARSTQNAPPSLAQPIIKNFSGPAAPQAQQNYGQKTFPKGFSIEVKCVCGVGPKYPRHSSYCNLYRKDV